MRGMVPWVVAVNAEGLEMFGVSRHDGHLRRLRDGGDEGVVQRCVFRNPKGGKGSRGWQVEREYAVGEGRQDAFFEPSA